MNVLIYADFGKWEQEKLDEVMDFIESITDNSESNLIYRCYNPIQTICLGCEHLMKIGDAIGLYKHRGKNISLSL